MHNCTKCKEHGLEFCRNYSPDQFIEGWPASPIWVVSLNPKQAVDWRDERRAEELSSALKRLRRTSFFKEFQTVSSLLYQILGEENGVAHTDLVKCSSPTFPPRGIRRQGVREVIMNCTPYLQAQLAQWKPRIVICNGVPVCRGVQQLIPPPQPAGTSYMSNLDGQEVGVVLSGFLGRLDRYAKARLGQEVEGFMEHFGLLD